jgi:O-acetylserine/cysteine efflux transporter
VNPLHIGLAVLITAIWGTNFVVIKFGLGAFPPFLFAALRFGASAFPWLLFVERPRIPWRFLIQFGLLLGAGQFGLLFLAMRHDISPGLASLLMQSQAFITIVISALVFHERLKPLQILALSIAAVGVGLIGWHTVMRPDTTVTLKGFLLLMAASTSWSCANLVVRRAGRVNMLGFMVWSSLFSVPPLLALHALTDGWAGTLDLLAHAHWIAWVTVAWQAIGNTLIGFGIWNWLLMRYPAATITPMALLVPVFGMTSSALVLGEPLPLWKVVAGLFVIAGLTLNFLAARRPGRQ